MEYEISIESLEPQPYLGITVQTTVNEIGQTLQTCYSELMEFMQDNDIVPLEPPFARYNRMEQDGTVELVAGVPVPEGCKGKGKFKYGMLPGGEVAFTSYIGPYENLHKPVMALQAWMDDKGITPKGGHWEHYVDDPEEVPAPQLRTDIYWPIA
jgi:effector-binding domain-containing protein